MAISKSQMKCEEKGELEQTSVSCGTPTSEDELLRKVFSVLIITVVCVASLESLACCTGGCLGWFLFHIAVLRVKSECSS